MIHLALQEQLQSLQQLLHTISINEYKHKSNMLGSNSIGQHVRHVVEMIECLLHGYETGLVNYDDRKRNSVIETDKIVALGLLQELLCTLYQQDKQLTLQLQAPGETVQTSYNRELLYNSEHAIHHMALIKVALREMQLDITDANFGVAPATIRYNNATPCAQ